MAYFREIFSKKAIKKREDFWKRSTGEMAGMGGCNGQNNMI